MSRSRNSEPDNLEPSGLQDEPSEDFVVLDNDAWRSESQSVPSIGDYLTKQRQLRGISREELCTLTRIPMRSLERLESGAFDSLDDGFVRGFVRTVASALGLDPDDTLSRMIQEPEGGLDATRSIAAAGMMRVGLLAAGLVLVLISAGLVRVAVQHQPGQLEADATVIRVDPVRALALETGASGFSANHTLVSPILPTPPDAEVPEAPPGEGSLNADLPIVKVQAEMQKLEP